MKDSSCGYIKSIKSLSKVVCGVMLVVSFSSFSYGDYKDASLPIEKRVEDLLKKMTLEEKVFQLSQITTGGNDNPNNIGKEVEAFNTKIGSTIMFSQDPRVRNAYQKQVMEKSRLAIPVIFGYDVIHGYKTIFPVPLAQACSWNPDLVKEGCAVAAAECKDSGIDWTFSPMIDVARDPRWGRVVEGYGEDPYATGVFAEAAVKGYQGETIPYKVIACLKHFVGYGESEGGRDYAYSDISDQSLWETYLPPYEAGVKAGARTLMGAFNDINGVPASANPFTLTEVLRNKWGFTGFVVSDWGSVNQLKAQGYEDDPNEIARKAISAGLDMEMVDTYFRNHLPALVEQKKMDPAIIDEAVRRVLRVKFEAGLFDKPYVEEKSSEERFLRPEYREKSRQMAVESMVLLKNEGNLLPLDKNLKNIALIGPLAKDKRALMGSWCGRGEAKDVVDIEEGLRSALEKSGQNLHYAKGCEFDKISDDQLKEALETAKKSDVILLCIGEHGGMSGENASRSTIALTPSQIKLANALADLKKPMALLLVTGRPNALEQLEKQVKSLLVVWQPGTEAGNAVADLVTGKENPSGRLAITFPRTEGQIPIYYNMRNRARPHQGYYQDLSTDPMYWFGDGMGYSEFDYKNMTVTPQEFTKNDAITVSVEVENKGKMEGKETVFLYVHDKAASVSQPLKKLVAFKKVNIPAGKTEKISFTLTPEQHLSFVDSKGKRLLEPGVFGIMIKNDRKEITLK